MVKNKIKTERNKHMKIPNERNMKTSKKIRKENQMNETQLKQKRLKRKKYLKFR